MTYVYFALSAVTLGYSLPVLASIGDILNVVGSKKANARWTSQRIENPNGCSNRTKVKMG